MFLLTRSAPHRVPGDSVFPRSGPAPSADAHSFLVPHTYVVHSSQPLMPTSKIAVLFPALQAPSVGLRSHGNVDWLG